MRLCILASGGLDSTVAWYYAEHQGYDNKFALWVDIGQPYREKEERAVDRLSFPVTKLRVPGFVQHQNAFGAGITLDQQVIPGRNLLFVTLAGCLLAERVWVGALDGEMHGQISSRDKSPEFFHMASGVLSYTMKMFVNEIVVEAPFKHLTKAGVVRWALDNGVPEDILRQTSTCYHPTMERCGLCGTCFKRWIAFTLNGLEERYDNPPWECEYAKRTTGAMVWSTLKGDWSYYNKNRVRETLTALRTVRSLTRDEDQALRLVK